MKLTFRGYQGNSDCLAMLRIREESAVADHVDRLSTCEKFPSLESIRESVDQPDVADRLLFLVDGANLVGYSQITWWEEADGTWLYLHNEWVLPAYRTDEPLHAFQEVIERHITTLAKRQGRTKTAVFGANASETEQYRVALLTSRGYKQVWSQVDMELEHLSSQDPTWPPGITVKPLTPADYPQVWAVDRQAYADAFGKLSDHGYDDFVQDIEHPEMCFAAWDGNELVGYALCTENFGMAFIDEVVTAPNYRRRGIARSLMEHTLAQLRARGYNKVRLLTATNNHSGARSLYEKLGFRTVKKYMRYRKPVSN